MADERLFARGHEVMSGVLTPAGGYAARVVLASLEAAPADADLSAWHGLHRVTLLDPYDAQRRRVTCFVYVFEAGGCPPARIVRTMRLWPTPSDTWHDPPWEPRPVEEVCLNVSREELRAVLERGGLRAILDAERAPAPDQTP
jgi:hypothetical protein